MLAFSFNISSLFSVNLFFIFYFLFFLEPRVRDKMTESFCHTPVISDDTVTSHEVIKKDEKGSG